MPLLLSRKVTFDALRNRNIHLTILPLLLLLDLRPNPKSVSFSSLPLFVNSLPLPPKPPTPPTTTTISPPSTDSLVKKPTSTARMESLVEGDESSSSRSCQATKKEDYNTSPIPTSHFCFLVHGWLGNDEEMSYLEQALRKASSSPSSQSESSNMNNINNPIIVHKTRCNVGRTHDGIANGGKRLAKEVAEVIFSSKLLSQRRSSSSNEDDDDDDDDVCSNEEKKETQSSSSSSSSLEETVVTISFVGNSLGGLYARYAISVLNDELDNERRRRRRLYPHPSEGSPQTTTPTITPPLDDDDDDDDYYYPQLKIHNNIFLTTATPHLGVASHTYITIPRIAEKIIGTVLGTTGRDLFRLENDDATTTTTNDLIYDMSTRKEFLIPLSEFRRRKAYANAFWNDFQVPTNTAAFLNEKSTEEHELVMMMEGGGVATTTTTRGGELVASVTTAATYRRDHFDATREQQQQQQERDETNSLLTMSRSLDSLGWEKHFFDVRHLSPVPGIKMPFVRESREVFGELITQKMGNDDDDDDGRRVILTSGELARYLGSTGERLTIPLGHTIMVANAKSSFYSELNKGGRPVMDRLAEELVKDIRSWEEEK